MHYYFIVTYFKFKINYVTKKNSFPKLFNNIILYNNLIVDWKMRKETLQYITIKYNTIYN